MKTLVLVVCLTLAAIACRAEDYHLIQSQVADEVPMHGPVDKATVYVLLCPDHRVYVFRAFDSHEMEEVVKHFPRGSVLHYDGNALIASPKQAEIDKLKAFCKSKGITLELTPTS
jgi:hypothetical protein